MIGSFLKEQDNDNFQIPASLSYCENTFDQTYV